MTERELPIQRFTASGREESAIREKGIEAGTEDERRVYSEGRLSFSVKRQ